MSYFILRPFKTLTNSVLRQSPKTGTIIIPILQMTEGHILYVRDIVKNGFALICNSEN